MTIEIREARPEEYAEAGRVTASAYREFVQGADWEEYLERIADVAERAERTTILVAVEDRAILGSLTLELGERVRDDEDHRPLDPDEAHVRMLGVDPSTRRRGIARRLMLAAEEVARAAGRRRLTLNTTHRMRSAQEMYASLGYRRLEDRVFDDGFVVLSYEKAW